ncbi:hydrogenase maturation protein HypF [Actinoplanes campanulatus]|uniref:Carbamoyltransferase n=1 Tax=Actinoplanes campanulatus TaxID=113559 RepID=A0A7W5ARG9_9ACTN|nr:carbamoyltransferase HypF [Actinoplanes campanulatus]MBB3101086.1 hydrogenase maturation protein HypF [Actinoplanes campanulatus]GGN51765.1 carbamoyltransferase [Actinoplanes campanulatus]GID42053.1 carbamoyltransferase [Actinoplanes campanulatus]
MTAWSVRVRGTVQGVGFRPFVHRVATGLSLDGEVRNVGGDVLIDVGGPEAAVTRLVKALRDQAPPAARVVEVIVAPAEGAPAPGFRVTPSGDADLTGGFAGLPADLATCDDCLHELFDPGDRRFRYPFINCTNCGPRATIVDALPYDRERTAMAGFTLCRRCAAEYCDPSDRRFHAEPVACPACGPRLTWHAGKRSAYADQALTAAAGAIGVGRIVAVKGLGGYQLICDATDPSVVERLRHRKQRPRKPFAVMVVDLGAAHAVADLCPEGWTMLTSPARPIVLLPARAGSPVAAAVAPGVDRVGLFLPYTPLHHLLLRTVGRPLVVTSGNRADEPIAIGDADAATRLAGIADGFLSHDRPIRARYDDSVVHIAAGTARMLRRARGYAPGSLPLPVPARRPVLAVGAQLKHTFTLARGDRALVGPHGGDLADADTLAAFRATVAQLSRLHRFEPEVVAHDLHPDYLSTAYAREAAAGPDLIGVQHHHAHVVSCAAEHGVDGPFLGIAYDGLGYGDDGRLWGGELLLATYTGFRRLGRFGAAPLPGGEAAVRRPARTALGYLYGGEFPLPQGSPPALCRRMPAAEQTVVRRMIERRVNSPYASSTGRFLDVAASLLGICDDNGYEGEAAILLESAAHRATGSPAPLPWRLTEVDGLWVYDWSGTLGDLLSRHDGGEPAADLALAVHRAVVDVTVELCGRAAESTGVRVVCLSGGCMQNRILAGSLPPALRAAGLTALLNRDVPAGDGGISYGQAVVAAARLAGGG